MRLTDEEHKQTQYNLEHGIEPVSIIKEIYDISERLTETHEMKESREKYGEKPIGYEMGESELKKLINEYENEMKKAAQALEFERAAILRDKIYEFKVMIAEGKNLKPWERARYLADET